ncbi:hypothetical protein KC19_11G138600 [Ceratodon purpureus]|uniref:RING-type E3 ubiquitin transferase n=1 Tax=Ceratodon purpureus TaxID=3225 RepID=A0A8T0GKD0_CERPU|nr:hypothetical protein KC19_11G138600 [Ceratodon purpureus]
MNQRYPIRMQYLDSGNNTNYTSPYSSSAPAGPPVVGPPKTNAFSPAVVAVIGVLAGAFLIVSYYRIFLRYFNRQQFTFWGARSDGRNGGPSTIVLMEEHTWPPDSSGLDESLISRIPTCKYKSEEGLVDGTECSVCLGEFEEGEELRILPKCNHPFHIPCIDTWLATSSTCPLCRVNIVLAAAVPYALMSVEREPPAAARGPSMSFIPAANANPMQTLINHEIEILQEQHGQEFLEAGQLSGPSSSRASSRGSFNCPPDVDQTPDSRRGDSMPGSITQHMRHLSLETDSSTTTREIHVVNDSQASSEGINRPVPASVTKRRLYSRARREGHRHRSEGGLRVADHKGKHPILPMSPKRAQTKRFARLMGSSSVLSRSTTGSSSLNQVVVELLAQEIFQNSTSTNSRTTTLSEATGSSTIAETGGRRVSRVRSSKEASTSDSNGSSSFQRPPRVRHDNASFEVMWSINEQENPLMGPFSSFRNRGSSSERMEFDSTGDLTERFPDSLQLSSDPNSDCEDGLRSVQKEGGHSRSKSLKRSLTKYADLQTWPSKRHSLRDSMARLSKRYGAVNLRQNSFRRTEKVHASEPEFEMFDF